MGKKSPRVHYKTIIYDENDNEEYVIENNHCYGIEMAGINLNIETQARSFENDDPRSDGVLEDALSASLNEAFKWHVRFLEKYIGL